MAASILVWQNVYSTTTMCQELFCHQAASQFKGEGGLCTEQPQHCVAGNARARCVHVPRGSPGAGSRSREASAFPFLRSSIVKRRRQINLAFVSVKLKRREALMLFLETLNRRRTSARPPEAWAPCSHAHHILAKLEGLLLDSLQ